MKVEASPDSGLSILTRNSEPGSRPQAGASLRPCGVHSLHPGTGTQLSEQPQSTNPSCAAVSHHHLQAGQSLAHLEGWAGRLLPGPRPAPFPGLNFQGVARSAPVVITWAHLPLEVSQAGPAAGSRLHLLLPSLPLCQPQRQTQQQMELVLQAPGASQLSTSAFSIFCLKGGGPQACKPQGPQNVAPPVSPTLCHQG